MKRAAIYVRVSTDRQTVENQTARLTQIAEARGWQIVQTFSDAGVSGAKGRNERPGFDQMLKHAQRHRFDVVMVWAIDRIGRSLIDLLGTIQHLEACGVDLYLDQQAIDTTTPSGKLMFQVTGAFAEFERAMIRQRIHAGLKRAVANGKTLGRPLNDHKALEKARTALSSGLGINKVARQVGLRTRLWRASRPRCSHWHRVRTRTHSLSQRQALHTCLGLLDFLFGLFNLFDSRKTRVIASGIDIP
jgi:DNA invertase Pin-like site-specific DNA recombinase